MNNRFQQLGVALLFTLFCFTKFSPGQAQIIVFGIGHGVTTTDGSKVVQNQVDAELVSLAKANKFYLGLEGIETDSRHFLLWDYTKRNFFDVGDHPKLQGIESAAPYAVQGAMLRTLIKREGRAQGETHLLRAMAGFTLHTRTNGLLRQAHLQFLQGHPESKLALGMAPFLSSTEPLQTAIQTETAAIRQGKREFSEAEETAYFGALAQAIWQKSDIDIKAKKALTEFFANPWSPESFRLGYAQVARQWRDQALSTNIQLLETKAAKESLDLVVRIGAAHLPALVKAFPQAKVFIVDQGTVDFVIKEHPKYPQEGIRVIPTFEKFSEFLEQRYGKKD